MSRSHDSHRTPSGTPAGSTAHDHAQHPTPSPTRPQDQQEPSARASHGVVVGVDGSEQSISAARWASREAELRGQALTLVTAYSVPVFAASAMEAGYGMADDAALREGAEQVLQSVIERLGEVSVPVTTHVVVGDAAGVLVDCSEDAELLVVGSRGRGGFLGRLLGSVASALPAHSQCPVVIVPNGDHSGRAQAGAAVVVGLDGSERGRLAGLAAAQEASLRQAPLHVVVALPPISGTAAWLPATVDEQGIVADLQTRLEAGMQWLRSEYPGLEVTGEIVDGTPVDVLVEQSRTARLTMVGTRGRGGFVGALLGSTSQGLIAHAQGPVMVVPFIQDSRLAHRSSFGPLLD